MSLELTALIECESCEAVYEGYWHDDSMSVQDMAEPPEAEQTCTNCGHVQREPYPGWTFQSEAG